jgi:prevent-host-death family protein
MGTKLKARSTVYEENRGGVLEGLVRSVLDRVTSDTLWKFSVRDLARKTSSVLASVYKDRHPAVITYRGVPSFLLLPLDRDDARAVLLGSAAVVQDRIKRSEESLPSI